MYLAGVMVGYDYDACMSHLPKPEVRRWREQDHTARSWELPTGLHQHIVGEDVILDHPLLRLLHAKLHAAQGALRFLFMCVHVCMCM